MIQRTWEVYVYVAIDSRLTPVSHVAGGAKGAIDFVFIEHGSEFFSPSPPPPPPLGDDLRRSLVNK